MTAEVTEGSLTNPNTPEHIGLGTNEFEGIGLLYGVPTQSNSILLPGAFAGSQGRPFTVHWEHRDPIGVCTLRETPRAPEIKGQINCTTIVGRKVLQALHVGFLGDLCMTFEVDEETTCAANGRVYNMVKRARLIEVSLVLASGAGGRITSLGAMDLTPGEFEHRFLDVGPELMRRSSELLRLQMVERLNFGRPTYLLKGSDNHEQTPLLPTNTDPLEWFTAFRAEQH